MRSISYSPNNSRVHTRRNTLNTVTAPPSAYTPTLTKRGDLYSQSVPNVVLPIIKPTQMTSMTTLTTASSIDQSSLPPNNLRLINNMSIDTNATTDIDEELSQDSNASNITKYTDSEIRIQDQYKLPNKNQPNVRIINMRDPISITVPEDAVLTPDKDHGLKKSLDIDIKEPQNKKTNENVISENVESNLDINGSNNECKNEFPDSNNSDEGIMDPNHLKNVLLDQPNSNISVHSNVSLQSNESEVTMPDQNNLRLDKVQIYSQSRSSAPSITSDDQEKP